MRVLGFVLVALLSPAALAGWHPYGDGPEDMEFGILSTIGGVPTTGPSLLQTGYDGAYAFPAGPVLGSTGNTIGWGETFVVPTERVLTGVQFRVGQSGPDVATGTISIGVYEFDLETNTPVATLAQTTRLASSFTDRFDKDPAVTTISFDSGSLLLPGRTYLLGLKSEGGFGTAFIGAAAAQNLYSGGQSFYFEAAPVPEPASIAALGLGALGLLKRRKKV